MGVRGSYRVELVRGDVGRFVAVDAERINGEERKVRSLEP